MSMLMIVSIFKSLLISVIISLLSIFVPRSCSSNNEREICSFLESTSNSNLYTNIVLTFNFVTLCIYISSLMIEYCREDFIKRFFVSDSSISSNYLKDNYSNLSVINPINPEVRIGFIKLNFVYFYFTLVLLLFNMINVILSIILLYIQYLNYYTVVVLSIYIILIYERISFMVNISKMDKDFLICSTYSSRIYNRNI